MPTFRAHLSRLGATMSAGGEGKVLSMAIDAAHQCVFERMLEAQRELIATVSPAGAVLYANRAFRRYFSVTDVAGANRPSLSVVLGDAGLLLYQRALASTQLHSTGGVSFDLSLQSEAGERHTVWWIAALRDADQELESVLLVGRDITDDRRKEHALGDALGEVEKLTRQMETERRYLREEINAMVDAGEMIGDTPRMRALMDQIVTVAPTDSSVLILGETGTGKEVVARLIHQASTRARLPLVKVNCAALPATLVESELFGHERGAFTGAVSRRLGRFEIANQGTIFLDEVGEIPLETQAKLLRVLQEHELERVGSSQPIRVDVRVIAATNRDLREEVAAGRFRADLYYRLAVFPLHLPPLRERVEDIPKLANHFLERGCRGRRAPCRGFTEDALAWLTQYPWPGNVRELQNIVERASILVRGEWVDLSLLKNIGGGVTPFEPAAAVKSASASPDLQELVTLEEMEKRYIERVLQECGARIEGENGAANILGLPPSTLRSRMRKLGVRKSNG